MLYFEVEAFPRNALSLVICFHRKVLPQQGHKPSCLLLLKNQLLAFLYLLHNKVPIFLREDPDLDVFF